MPQCLGHGHGPFAPAAFYVPPASSTPLAVVPQDAAVDFQGVAQVSFTAEKVLEAAAVYQGVGLFSATSTKILEGSAAYQGVGLLGATGQKVLEGSAAYQGVGLAGFNAGKVLEGSIGYSAVGMWFSAGSVVNNASVSFVASAYVVFAGIKPWEHQLGARAAFGEVAESPIAVGHLGGTAIMATSQAGSQMTTSEVPESQPAYADVTESPVTTTEVSESTPTYTDVR